MTRWFPAPFLSLALAALWLVLNNTLAAGQLLLALLVGWAVPLLFVSLGGGPGRERPLAKHAPWLALRLLGRLLLDIVTANLSVAAKILFVREGALSPGLVKVALRLDSPRAVAALAGIVTLTPGTLSADIVEDSATSRYQLLVHALDAPDPAALADEIRQRYEDLLLEMLR
ncbi:MAG TPA: Na+/H+ antiporter subunit E [Rhodocyclaceae bacterium]